MEPRWDELGAALTAARGDEKAAEVARKVGLSSTQLRNYERGLSHSGRPSAQRIVDLAGYYGVDPQPRLDLVGYKIPRRVALDSAVSVPSASLGGTAEGAVGEQGRLVDEERRMVGEAAELLAQAAAILAKIARAEDSD